MKAAIIIFGLILTFVLRGLVGQTPTPLPTMTPIPAIIFHDPNRASFGGEQYNSVNFSGDINGPWLTVRRHKSHSGGEKGWEASYTEIESDFKPHVEKKGAKWLIQFSTEDITTEFVP